jgi:pimeloyl-ACP methyl ester carboxylesterase
MSRLLLRFLPCIGVLFAAALARAASPGVAVAHRLHIDGAGPVTVVFESGLGDTLESWRQVQSMIPADCATTLSYNRAGYPGSEPANGVRDARTVVAELRSELARRGLKPPYVLVGHSLGGLYMQYFARRHPDEVSGLVLVDSTHWNQQLLMGLPITDPAKRDRVLVFMSLIARKELEASALAGAQVRQSAPARPIPTIVLSSTAAVRNETPATRAQAARLQEDIVSDFPGARHVRVEGSGHYIQHDRPAVVADAIRELARCKSGT